MFKKNLRESGEGAHRVFTKPLLWKYLLDVEGVDTYLFMDYFDSRGFTTRSTIFDIPMRPLREDHKHRHRFTR